MHTAAETFTICARDHDHWGLHGAAGLLLVADDAVLLHRRPSGCWGIPGGAKSRHESTIEAAMREATEETTVDLSDAEIIGQHVADCGDWTYTTTAAELPTRQHVELRDHEGTDVRWVPIADVLRYRLHPGLYDAWPALSALIKRSPR